MTNITDNNNLETSYQEIMQLLDDIITQAQEVRDELVEEDEFNYAEMSLVELFQAASEIDVE